MWMKINASSVLTGGPAEVCAADVTRQIASTMIVATARTLRRLGRHINKPGAFITIIEISTLKNKDCLK